MQVNDYLLYRGIENQPSPAFSSLYLSDFLSLFTLNDVIFCNIFHSNHSYLVYMVTMISLSLDAFCYENNTIWFKQLSGGIVRFANSST